MRGHIFMDSDMGSLYEKLENEFIDCDTLTCFSRKVLDVLKGMLGFRRGEMLIYNQELKEFELIAEAGAQGSCTLSRFKIHEYENPALMALLENRIIHIRNVNCDFEYFSKLYGLTADEEVFSIPLSTNGVVFGVLQFFSGKENEEDIKKQLRNGIDLEDLAEWLGEKIYRIMRLENLKSNVYRKLLEYAGFIAIIDNEDFILDCSTSFERLLGYSHGELIGVNIKEVHKGYSAGSAILVGKNGTILACHESTEAILDREGKPSGYIKIFTLDKDVKSDSDITSVELESRRKEALEKIKENLEYFELLADKLINPIAIIRGSIELKDEIDHDRLFSTLIQQIDRINHILEEFRRREKETFRTWMQLNNRHEFHRK